MRYKWKNGYLYTWNVVKLVSIAERKGNFLRGQVYYRAGAFEIFLLAMYSSRLLSNKNHKSLLVIFYLSYVFWNIT